MRVGFDHDQYTAMQSEHIRQSHSGRLAASCIWNWAGKLFDDFHASRVLPGFRPDSKVTMLLQLKGSGRAGDRHQRGRH